MKNTVIDRSPIADGPIEENQARRVSRDSILDSLPPLSLLNWQEAPYNRWGFSHVQEIVPTTTIHRTSRGERSSDSRGRDDLFLEALVPDLSTFLSQSYTDAIVVSKNGVVVYERYFGSFGAGDKHLLMSVSKSLCGLIIGSLVDSGELMLDHPVSFYVPELGDSAYGDATIQQVLDMTVAVNYNEDYRDSNSEVQAQDRVAGWRPRLEGDPADTYSFLRTLRKSGEHGRLFQYCSAGTDVLAWVAESITGRRYSDILSSALWSKLGAKDDAVITTDPGGFAFANGGIACTARDLSLVGKMMSAGGVLGDTRLVSESWVAETLAGGNEEAAAGTAYQRVHPRGTYRNHWWVTGDERGSFYAIGIHGQFIWVDPTSDTVIVKFSSWPEAITEEWNRIHASTFRNISEALGE